MIGMGEEASTIVWAEAANFVFYCWAVKIPSDECVRDIPGGIHYHAQGLRVEYFQDFNVRGGSSAPELYTIGPDESIIVTRLTFHREGWCTAYILGL
jgi:hypothetical protein